MTFATQYYPHTLVVSGATPEFLAPLFEARNLVRRGGGESLKILFEIVNDEHRNLERLLLLLSNLSTLGLRYNPTGVTLVSQKERMGSWSFEAVLTRAASADPSERYILQAGWGPEGKRQLVGWPLMLQLAKELGRAVPRTADELFVPPADLGEDSVYAVIPSTEPIAIGFECTKIV